MSTTMITPDYALLKQPADRSDASLEKGELRLRAVGLFLAGALSGIDVRILGLLPVGEIILTCSCLLVQAGDFRRKGTFDFGFGSKTMKWLVAMQVVALAGLICTDIWRESYPNDFLRGWMRMILLLVDVVGFSVLSNRSWRLLVFFQYGLILSALSVFVVPPLFGDYWKFGFGGSATILALWLLPKLRSRAAAMVGIGSLAVLHYLLGARGSALILLPTLLALCVLSFQRSRRKVVALVMLVILAGSFIVGKSLVMERRSEGGEQSNVERMAMMRTAWEGFLQSPLLGHGSWFSRSDLNQRFVQIRSNLAYDLGGGLGFDDAADGQVAVHSQILMALAEGGIFGGSFFITYIIILILALWRRVMEMEWTAGAPLEISILIGSFYGTFMSPFSGPHLLYIAFGAVTAASILKGFTIGSSSEEEMP